MEQELVVIAFASVFAFMLCVVFCNSIENFRPIRYEDER